MNFDRRTALLGLAGLAAGAPAFADSDSPIAHGVLADNKLAQSFEPMDRTLARATLVGPEGEFSTETLKGRTILLPLWAEWCAPCLSEIPDFARLQKRYGNDKFAIIPVLSGTRRQMTLEAISTVFRVLHADIFNPVMEKGFGDWLLRTMARRSGGYVIPCNLLIAPDGTVVGREIGRETAPDASDRPAPPKTADAETVTRAIAGQAQSLWGKQEGADFAAAMAMGFLG